MSQPISFSQIPNKRSIIAWCFYDWANSSFFTVVLTFIFATYFTKKVALNTILGTAQWGYAIALSGLLIAIIGPILGAIVDQKGRRKPWIFIFSCLTVIASALLWFIKPEISYVTLSLGCLVVGVVSIEIAIIFYNAMLKDLAPKNYVGRISGWAWGCGYAGGLLCLSVALFVFVQGDPAWLGLSAKHAEHIRICGPLVAIWFGLFSLPLFFFTKDRESTGTPLKQAIRIALKQLWHTLISLKDYKELLKFLIARMLYIDGLNTIFAFGGIYAAGTFGLSFAEVIQFGIAMNVAAGVGAVSFAWLDDWFGAKATILFALGMILIFATGILLVKTKLLFWVFGMGVSICIGPIQSASRSMMVRLSPHGKVTEMFGLYALSGKATAFIGPWLLGVLTIYFNSQRIGLSSVLAFLLSGGILLCFVKSPKNR
jgi:UMF1 family MFS transporter